MKRTTVPLNLVMMMLFWVINPIGMAQSDDGAVAWWKFDEGAGTHVLETIHQQEDSVVNRFEWVDGVSGTGLKFDGFTTVIKVDEHHAPHLEGNFTVEAWVALQEYPVNWVPILDQEKQRHAGYYFGIDAEGRLGLQLSVWGNWEECASSIRVPLGKWTHVVGVYDEKTGIKLYLDGKLAGNLPVQGRMTPANVGLQIGRNFADLPPTALVRTNVSFPALYSLDGILDNLKIYDRAFGPQEVERAYDSVHPAKGPAFSARNWPVLPAASDEFSAVHCKLRLYPEWDAIWRSEQSPDVVIRFEGMAYKYVFWRGSNFEENLVTENNIWVGDQSFESGTEDGCAEHMSDKKALHQSIAIVERNAARVVLHWRYALVDVRGNFSNVDPLTGWGDWADEYFYVYPDGVAVRYGTVHGTAKDYSFTEPTILIPPGKKAEDYISLDAVTVSNMQGQSRSYSWSPQTPSSPFPDMPAGANIAKMNLKSVYKPFFIYLPGTSLGPYGWPPEIRELYSHFPTWNHWPVNQAPSDGRFAMFPDRYSSAAVMSPDVNGNWIEGPGPTKSTYFLFGLTDKPAADLAPLARSWLHPPQLRIDNAGYVENGYSKSERAYSVVRQQQSDAPSALRLKLEGSNESPVVDPAIVIKDWGRKEAKVSIDGKRVQPGADLGVGHINRLEGTDLVLWVRKVSTKAVTINVVPEAD